ncbi:MAG: alpha/beta hydrolase [Verrucomicrobiales bacterium]|nr:alpha/beta hydrolase [Verrucomicrobiales bacterium]
MTQPSLLLALTLLTIPGTGKLSAQSMQKDLEYARLGERSLTLDLHLPTNANPPLIVYIHGGAWRAGSKTDVPITALLDHGFAIASVEYRLSTEAVFPAQVHDIKAAIRFLRAKATTYQVDASRVGIVGTSAGGHLAALVGVTNHDPELEGKVGDHLDQDCGVQAIISLYGASDLTTILSQSTPFGLKMRVPALQLLLGGTPEENPDLAKLASPVAHLDANDPPLLLIHGDADPQMPPAQSQELAAACEALKLPVQLILMPGSKHGGPEFYDVERTQRMADFLTKHLQP